MNGFLKMVSFMESPQIIKSKFTEYNSISDCVYMVCICLACICTVFGLCMQRISVCIGIWCIILAYKCIDYRNRWLLVSEQGVTVSNVFASGVFYRWDSISKGLYVDDVRSVIIIPIDNRVLYVTADCYGYNEVRLCLKELGKGQLDSEAGIDDG